VVALIAAAIAAAFEVRRWDLGPRSVRISLPPAETGSPPAELDVRRVRFPYGKDKAGLFHVAENYPALRQPGRVRMRTRLEIPDAKGLALQFEIYSAWPFQMFSDGQHRVSTISADFFEPISAYAELASGAHDIEILLDYAPTVGGFAASYSYWEPDGWRVRRFLGVPWDKVQFSLPESEAIESTAQTR
jgi:hypothetical protein